MRVVLVLGAGGPVGHAFHAGVLAAIREATSAHLGDAADLIIGTSAGAHAGALLRAGVAPEELLARRAAAAPRSPEARRPRGPASLRYLRRALSRPFSGRPGRLVAALLPEGAHHAEEQAARLNDTVGGAGWPGRPLWITAVDLDSGDRVVFGRTGTPVVDVGTAVRCSGAVPAINAPVRIGARRFVDGGVASATHADLVAEALGGGSGRALVVVSSPLSRFPVMGRLLRRELAGLDPRRARAILFEPDAHVARVMGWNPMDLTATAAVRDAAHQATLRRLAATPALKAALDDILER